MLPFAMPESPHIPVYEQYEGYAPPFDIKLAIERMLATVPSKYLVGLGSIVLTNEGALTGERARKMTWSRGKKVSAAKARGLYHPEWGSNPAWIELRIDSIFRNYSRRLLRFPMTRETELGGIFFHELGHHIHAQHRPEFKEKEDVADNWAKKGVGNYLWKRFWYLVPLFRLLKWLNRIFDIQGWLRRRIAARSATQRSTR
jgi:hypothetical protein